MPYKLTEQDCENILRDDTEEVHQIKLMELYVNLSLATPPHEFYRIQGEIAHLREIIGLHEKAENQLKRK